MAKRYAGGSRSTRVLRAWATLTYAGPRRSIAAMAWSARSAWLRSTAPAARRRAQQAVGWWYVLDRPP